ncbi:hypothetical protein A3860_19935 [Niastella vici]|uniref:Uncharacterized protein n=1 Tax=Niastella vici TaxID=1703345 RepID=A0A1V9G106_9BACT|nr:hypothetical protein A3860_19935 [Niastella vici]
MYIMEGEKAVNISIFLFMWLRNCSARPAIEIWPVFCLFQAVGQPAFTYKIPLFTYILPRPAGHICKLQ